MQRMLLARARPCPIIAAFVVAVALPGCDRLDPLKESVSEEIEAPDETPPASPATAAAEPSHRSTLDPPDTPESLGIRASQGDPVGQFWMGYFHEYGTRGVTKDLNAALNFYKLAAEQGDEKAVIAAERVEAKISNPKSETEDALEHAKSEKIAVYVERIKKAAEAGRPESQYLLGFYHEYGRYGVEQNVSLARDYYQKAAEQGHEKAMIALERISQPDQ